jgi:hypothetical protein
MSFSRHQEIFPSDGGASPAADAPAHRLDEFPTGYSSAGCSPALPASASPAVYEYAVMSSCRSRSFHRTANCVLTVCVSRGGKRTVSLARLRLRTFAVAVYSTTAVPRVEPSSRSLFELVVCIWRSPVPSTFPPPAPESGSQYLETGRPTQSFTPDPRPL